MRLWYRSPADSRAPSGQPVAELMPSLRRARARRIRSARSKCRINRLEQGRVAKWLEQAVHGTLLEHPWTHALVSLRGDEDDGNVLPAQRQFPLELGSGHARHSDVED